MSGSTLVTSSILDTSRLERIKVSSSTFTEIISDSDTFGQELSQIKVLEINTFSGTKLFLFY